MKNKKLLTKYKIKKIHQINGLLKQEELKNKQEKNKNNNAKLYSKLKKK